jgi:peptidyl-prolyl cis-trans isomerase SurA
MRRAAPAWLAGARLAAALAAAALAPRTAAAAEELVDGIAAQVGSDIVLVSEVRRAAQPMESQMRQAGAPESEIDKARAAALEQLIETRLIARVAKQSELRPTDQEIDEAIEGIAKENGLSLEQLKASVTSHDISYKEYRDQIRQELERRKILQTMISSRVHIEPEDLKRMYAERYADQPQGGEAVHVRQIIVVAGPEANRTLEQACELTRVAKVRISDGVAFEDLAREISAVAPQEGGDIGWIHADSMAPWMHDALASLEPGGVTGVLELPFGCSLMQLVERRDWKPVSFEDAKPMLEQQVFEQKLSDAYREWMNELRENSYIERRGYFAEAAKLGAVKDDEEAEADADGESVLPEGILTP